MWYFGSKCWRIRAWVKASYKQLKAVLVLGVRNFGLVFVALKLVEFPLFDNFFSDLAGFQDLDVFLLFDFFDLDSFFDFLACFTPFPPTPNLLISPLPLFFLKTGLLLLFLLKADLPLLFLLKAGLLSDPVIFSIKVSGAVILLKPWMNCQKKLAKSKKI